MRLVLAVCALIIAGCDGRAAEPAHSSSIFDVGVMRVQDQAELLTGPQEIELTRLSEQLEKDTTDQLVIVTLKSLEGRDIAELGTELGNRWGIGRADVDNGVLLIVAPSDRKVRISTGLGMEGLLTDAKAAEIVDEMVRSFRGGRYFDGVQSGAGRIDAILRSDLRRPQYRPQPMRKAA